VENAIRISTKAICPRDIWYDVFLVSQNNRTFRDHVPITRFYPMYELGDLYHSSDWDIVIFQYKKLVQRPSPESHNFQVTKIGTLFIVTSASIGIVLAGNCNCVSEKSRGCVFRHSEVSKEVLEPDHFLYCMSHRCIFRLDRRLSNRRLFLGLERNR
jgi:hypothetical protein